MPESPIPDWAPRNRTPDPRTEGPARPDTCGAENRDPGKSQSQARRHGLQLAEFP